jgi:hypothetical protein
MNERGLLKSIDPSIRSNPNVAVTILKESMCLRCGQIVRAGALKVSCIGLFGYVPYSRQAFVVLGDPQAVVRVQEHRRFPLYMKNALRRGIRQRAYRPPCVTDPNLTCSALLHCAYIMDGDWNVAKFCISLPQNAESFVSAYPDASFAIKED